MALADTLFYRDGVGALPKTPWFATGHPGGDADATLSATDFHPGVGSGAIDLGTGVPAGISPSTQHVDLPVNMEPPLKTNGFCPRPERAGEIDLGAMEDTP